MSWWRLKLLLRLWPKRTSAVFCANRRELTVKCGPYEVRLIIRDTSKPDGYSREELLEMLQTIRMHEKAQGWRVPEA